ncbi:MAG: glycoside hydrolase family 5 protein [Polyangiaceae bacterium]|jgi:aryl-phospho-beta-D-glucosidase BglC (GH1 family)
MQQWCANVVRIPLNQDFWLSDSPVYDANYAATVDTQVQWAEQAGLDVILDLHWSDRGDATVMQKCGCVTNSGSTACSGDCQQPMADSRSITFWGQLAAKYASDSQVLFELYNEPHDVAAAVWQSGGAASGSSLDNSSSSSFTVAGMQQLYNAVRAVAPDNLIIIGGLSYAYDLSAVSGNLPTGTNIIYNSHPYKTQYGTPSTADMESKFGFMAQNYPVIATEFGDTTTSQPAACDPTFYNSFISFANQQSTPSPSHKISWSAWAFFAGGCAFPSLISDSNYDTTAPGMAVEQALMAGP